MLYLIMINKKTGIGFGLTLKMEKNMTSINGCISTLEETLHVLSDIERRLAVVASRLGNSEGGLIKDTNLSGSLTAPDDLVSRFHRQLDRFMTLNTAIEGTITDIDGALGIDTGAEKPQGYQKPIQGRIVERGQDARRVAEIEKQLSDRKQGTEAVAGRGRRTFPPSAADPRPEVNDEDEANDTMSRDLGRALDEGLRHNQDDR